MFHSWLTVGHYPMIAGRSFRINRVLYLWTFSSAPRVLVVVRNGLQWNHHLQIFQTSCRSVLGFRSGLCVDQIAGYYAHALSFWSSAADCIAHWPLEFRCIPWWRWDTSGRHYWMGQGFLKKPVVWFRFVVTKVDHCPCNILMFELWKVWETKCDCNRWIERWFGRFYE